MNALGTVNDGEFEKMLKASKALKIKVNRDEFPKSPVVVWKLQGRLSKDWIAREGVQYTDFSTRKSI